MSRVRLWPKLGVDMVDMEEIADPRTVRAIEQARRSFARTRAKARESWTSEDPDADAGAEAEALGEAALAHLDGGRWDEARASAEAALELAEDHGHGPIWRNFGLLVEEAAETGREA